MHVTFDKNSRKGVFVLSQAVILKKLNIKDFDGKLNINTYIFDINSEKYGKICIRNSVPIGKESPGYKFTIPKKNRINAKCDTYFLLGFDSNFQNIEAVFIIPNDNWIKLLKIISIQVDYYASKYDQFKIDHIPFNEEYRNLKSYIEI